MRRALLAALLVLSSGCGYHLVGTSSFLPPELKTLYVDKLENRTNWADMDQRLGESLAREWVRRGRFRVVESAEGADLVLKGVIASLNVTPVTFDQQGRATDYQMTLVVAVRLVDTRGDEPVTVWEDQGFSRQVSYPVDVSAVDYFDRQVEAMEELSSDLARDLVTTVLEGF